LTLKILLFLDSCRVEASILYILYAVLATRTLANRRGYNSKWYG